jgi:HPt (histidine-containing phosphotransfer) domain-containing protein
MPIPPVLDLAVIENLRALSPDDGGEFVREIIGIFLSDTPQRLDELEQSLGAGDQVKFTRAAHSIKGSAANVGTAALGAVAQQLEAESKTAPLPTLRPLIDGLKAEFDRAKAELEKIER